MIRFIDIGDQITEGERHFAFFDTVTDRFLDVGGEQVFDSVVEFEESARLARLDIKLTVRCLGLVRESEAVHYIVNALPCEAACGVEDGDSPMTHDPEQVTCPKCKEESIK